MSTDTASEVLNSANYRELVENELVRATEFGDGCPARLADAIRYMVLAPGKRIRPLLVLYAAEACGGTVENAVPAAAAVEMLHTYSLIHDDLPAMDDDELRRGQLTCHKKFDEATAILAGDALQSRAFEVMAGVAQNAAECVRLLALASGAEHLVGGQVDDLNRMDGALESDQALQYLERIHRRKTSALISAATQIGGLTAGAFEDQLRKLRAYGRNLGLAFQIVDDLLDFAGDGSKMGKQTGVDHRNGTLTYPGLLGVERSQA